MLQSQDTYNQKRLADYQEAKANNRKREQSTMRDRVGKWWEEDEQLKLSKQRKPSLLERFEIWFDKILDKYEVER